MKATALYGKVHKGTNVFGLMLLAILLSTEIARAQLTTATLTGTVTDSTGAAIPNAKVAIVNVATVSRCVIATISRPAFDSRSEFTTEENV